MPEGVRVEARVLDGLWAWECSDLRGVFLRRSENCFDSSLEAMRNFVRDYEDSLAIIDAHAPGPQ